MKAFLLPFLAAATLASAVAAQSQTTITVDVVLAESGTPITDLMLIRAYETYLPEDAGPDFELERYGRLDRVAGTENQFLAPSDIAVVFMAGATGPEVPLHALQLDGSAEVAYTLAVDGGIVRLDVQSDGTPEFFVQADSPFDRNPMYSYSRGAPEDGQMVFLLPEGEWTFSAVDQVSGAPTVVNVVAGEILDATLDTRSGG